MKHRIYLDNAATSWPKPESVYRAMDAFHRAGGAPCGRGGYQSALSSSTIVDDCRSAAAALIGAKKATSVVFALNGTDALNMALYGTLRDGDHVVFSAAEHNSILRPLNALVQRGVIETSVIPVDSTGCWSRDDLQKALRPNTRLVAVTAVSNVTGAIQPWSGIKETLRHYRTLLLIDACQTLGHLKLNVAEEGVDLLATSGHKGLMGPLGTGFLYVRPDLEAEMEPFRTGGTGSKSEQERQPETMPDKFESGNLNVGGLAGLERGIFYLRESWDAITTHERQLVERMLQHLQSLPHVRLYGPLSPEKRTGIFAFAIKGYHPDEAASVLEMIAGIEVRAGLHCAPRLHAALGTLETGGLVRAAFGAFNSLEDVDKLADALKSMAT